MSSRTPSTSSPRGAQPLHPIRADLAGPFRQRPPVLPLQARGQPAYTPPTGPRLGTRETACHPLVHLVQLGAIRSAIMHSMIPARSPSAVVVLSVNYSGECTPKCSNRIALSWPRYTNMNAVTCLDDLY